MSGGSHRVCGGFGNGELTYDLNEIKNHHFQEWVKVRMGFAERLEMVNLPKIQVNNNSQFSRMSEGSYTVCGTSGNGEFT